MKLLQGTVVLSALVLTSLPRVAPAEDAESAARRGTRLYEEGRYEEAAEAFQQAQELARKQGDPPTAFDYNLGTTYARRGDFDRAVEKLKDAAEAPEPEETPAVRERAYYNLGVSAARKAQALREQGEGQLDAEYETLQQALEAFRQSLILEPSDQNARHNFAVTKRRVDEIEEMLQQQQQQQSEQGQGEPSDQPHGEGQQEQQQGEQAGDGPSGQNENQDSSESPSDETPPESSDSGESPESQESPPQAADASGQNQERSDESESAGEREQRSPEMEEGSPRETEDAESSQNREDEQAATSEKEQRGGLEATPTPTPTPEPRQSVSGPSSPHEEDQKNGSGNAGASRGADEPTPEQLDALRVLNSLEEGHPDQFRQLFRFRGGGDSPDLERDW